MEITNDAGTITAWQQWRQHPERLWVHKALFQIHLWVGAGVGLYVILMSVTGSILVFRNELSRLFSVEWLVKLHENLLLGENGRLVNGIGAIALTTVCFTGAIVWWPGVKNWRRSLKVSWGSRFARFNWDTHSALGFWFFPFVLMWAISGLYFSFPDAFYVPASFVDPSDKYTDQILFWLSELHFGRFRWYTEVLWTVFGLVPGVLAFTGVFACCHRMIYHTSSNPRLSKGASDPRPGDPRRYVSQSIERAESLSDSTPGHSNPSARVSPRE